jgi:hypothetical protein
MTHLLRSPVAAVGRWVRSVGPERAHLRADIVAGLPGAISSVPDGMAAAVLAGVNPVQGLPGAGTVCELRGAHRGRAQLSYPADRHHDDIRSRAGRGLRPAGGDPGPAASGSLARAPGAWPGSR